MFHAKFTENTVKKLTGIDNVKRATDNRQLEISEILVKFGQQAYLIPIKLIKYDDVVRELSRILLRHKCRTTVFQRHQFNIQSLIRLPAS